MKIPELNSLLPLNKDQKILVESIIRNFDEKQLSWLAGYLTGISLPQSLQTQLLSSNDNTVETLQAVQSDGADITLLFASRTGNGLSMANQFKELALNNGIQLNIKDMNEYPLNQLKDERNLLVVVSTHGEGVPPIAAEEFYNFIHGKRAPKLTNTKFSVLSLGDRSYLHFCKTGIDIDKRLEELGGQRIYQRVDCDVDFKTDSIGWFEGVLKIFESSLSVSVKQPSPMIQEVPVKVHNKQNPYKATLLQKIKLNGRGSGKETYHFELSLDDDGFTYEPGDAIGVFPVNSEVLVNEVMEALHLSPDDLVEIGNIKTTLKDALTNHLELSNLTPDVISKYNELAHCKNLSEILSDTRQLKEFMFGHDVVDLMNQKPVQISSQELTGILRKLQPRLYSIASSLKTHPQEVHLAIAPVRYTNGRYKEGVCSTFLSDRLDDDALIPIYHEKNPEFKLPANPEVPIIMVGPGTGVAPFRAFLEERQAIKASGKNWLFFGNWNFSTDFLYQTEFQNYHKKGLLTHLNVAFSRDTPNKVYVQHKMQKHARNLFDWLEKGAYFYVCGDMKHMWNDVNQTLMNIIRTEGGMSVEKAEDYFQNLKKTRRYQVDVY